MKYNTKRNDKYSVLTLEDTNLNSGIAPDLKSKFLILSEEGVRNLVLDLAQVEYVDSSGLSAILTGNRLWRGDRSFVLTGVNHPSVKKLIEISRLESVLTIIPTLQESIDFVMMEELERVIREEEE